VGVLEYALSLARDLAYSWPRGPHQYYLCATPPSVNKGFALLLTFNFAFILSDLGALSNAFLGRRSHNDVLVISEIRFLFQLNRDDIAQ
jgi:hypothetical protein